MHVCAKCIQSKPTSDIFAISNNPSNKCHDEIHYDRQLFW